MTHAFRCRLDGVKGIPDPTTESGELFLFDQALGQDGHPFVFLVEDPPEKTRGRHYHHGDVLYVYVKGEHHIEGEGTYRAGDLRWTRAGHAYGPETTGPEGGAWWVISYADPVPVNVSNETTPPPAATPLTANELARFARPYDWAGIDHAVQTIGGVILEGFADTDALANLDREIDAALDAAGAGPASGSSVYDLFLGHQTLRFHGLLEKVPASADLIGHPELVSWAERAIGSRASSVLLNAGELIQIQPGEPAQYLHRDTDSWPVPATSEPLLVNAILALDDFTTENGATHIVPDSWDWEPNRPPKSEEMARAVMQRGDAVLFRGDLLHGGGENGSTTRRRAISISYCAGWLRPVENSFLNLSREKTAALPASLQALVGYAAHDGTQSRGGMVGLYENGDPGRALTLSPQAHE